MKKIFCLITLINCLFTAKTQSIQISKADSIDSLSIKQNICTIKQVEVYSRLSDANIKAGSTGHNINLNQIKKLPRFIGESDPYKALQYMGGVSQAGEANAGLYVRGGNNDQNLILLNGTQIQNPTHVLGMFSVFNPDLIGQMHFIKSGIPAEYGGRISSVVDISTTNHIPEKTTIDGSIGIISSRICAHIPINRKFMIYGSIRGSYIGTTIIPLLRSVGIDSTLTQSRYEYWDVNAGMVFQVSKRDRISIHMYTGEDIIEINKIKKSFNFDGNYSNWGNTAAAFQYNRIFSDNWSMNHQLNYSGFVVSSHLNWLNSNNELHSENTNLNYKADFSHYILKHIVKFGTEVQFNKTLPNLIEIDSIIPIETGEKRNTFNTFGLSTYFRDEVTINKWLINYGLRANLHMHLGPYTSYNYGGDKFYTNNSIVKSYLTIEPRFFLRYLMTDNSSVKISASRINQFINQLPVLSIGLPTDIVIPSSLHIKPQSSWHYSGGYFKNLFNNSLEISTEIYYKTFENQLEMGNNPIKALTNNLLEQNLFSGIGWTYGSEITIKKNADKFSGWLSYNLAWSYRKFKQINNGKPYLAQNDRRHDVSLVLMYEFTKKINISALFVFATGNKVNLPVSWYIIDNKVIWEFGNYNAFEMPAYHRLDVSLNYKLNSIKGIKSELNFSIYNTYNRKNPNQIWFGRTANKYDYKIKMSYLLPIIPSISWTFHF